MNSKIFRIALAFLLFPYCGLGCLVGEYLFSQSTNQNYIVTTVPTAAVSDPSSFTTLNTNSTIQYFDGLGKLVQTVQKAQSSKDGTNWVDLVTMTEYDGIGRKYRQWLPVPATVNTGEYTLPATFTNNSSSFYSRIASDSYPFAETVLESSPLNRINGQKSPGASWYYHPTDIKYLTNTTEVAFFFVNLSNQLQRTGNYPANMLCKNQFTDEDGKTTTEYKNKQGQVVMKRSSTDVDTYYVYNDIGQLCYVLPPDFVDGIGTSTIFDDSNTLLKQYGYLYRYDERGNKVIKRLPGCDSICMVYDKADRLVLSQDGNQRAKTVRQWTATKYDIFGRVVYTGLLTYSYNRVQMKALLSNQIVTESYDGSASFYNTGYTNVYSIGQLTPLTVNYYDTYSFRKMQTAMDSTKLIYSSQSGYDAQYSNTKGLLTGTRIYQFNNSGTYLVTAFYYDKYGRVVQTRASNHLGGYDITYNALDFLGKPVKTYKTHGIYGAYDTYKELYTYLYDKAQRLLTTTYKLNSATDVILSDMTAVGSYDELGRLKARKRHNGTDAESFDYNIRNWTSGITSGTFQELLYYNTLPTGATNSPFYNGNIAYSVFGNTNSMPKRSYTYSYDNQNRLTSSSGYYFTYSQSSSAGNNESFVYDKQGNITSLIRSKDNTVIDNLTLHYTGGGNQVQWIDDAAGSQHLSSVKEYQNLSTAVSGEFKYDSNGNMVKDSDRDIVTIRYNILNLPDTVQFKNGNQIINRYAADGRKLGTEYFTRLTSLAVPLTTGQVIKQIYTINVVNQNGTAYIDNKEYNTFNGNSSLTALQRIYNTEGYAENVTATIPDYNYYRRDHLGNNREVWLATTNTTVQQTQYYPSGLPWANELRPGLQERKYNGKEFVEMHGFDTYDYGARGYYPAMGRFMTVDPLAEKYYSISPYAYCAGNPVRFVDPNGQDIWEVDSDGNIAYHEVDKSQDVIYKVSDVDANDDSNRVKNEDGTVASVSFDYDTVHSIRDDKKDQNGNNVEFTIFKVKGDDNAADLYNFMIDPKTNNVEWGHVETGTNKTEKNLVGNSHDKGSSGLGSYALNEGYTIRGNDHNHPSGTTSPSESDVDNARKISDKFKNATYNIFTAPWQPNPYNKNSPYMQPISPGSHIGRLHPGKP